MTDSKNMFVRHVHTGEIKKVNAEQRAKQDPNFWVRVTGDVKATAPETAPPVTDGETPAPKTTPKANAPKE